MAKFYSKTTAGFYDSDINKAMPDDVVPVADAAYAALFVAQADGHIIQADANGNPQAVKQPPLSAAQVAVVKGNAALAAGIAVTSSSTPELNGTYSLSPESQSDINAVATYIALNGSFPQGKAVTYWVDKDGNIHQFPSVAVFKAFATAVADFVDAVEDYMNSGGTVGAVPSNAVTIT